MMTTSLVPPSRKKKPKSRFADYEGVDEEGFIPNLKRETTMVDYSNDISRGPFYSMIDRQARARQAITGESYAKAFTECYTAPENIAIRDAAQFEHLAKSHDTIYGSGLSGIPVQKGVPPDPEQDFVKRAIEDRGPAHNKLHEMALEHSRAHGLSYQQSYTRLLTSPENIALRAGIAAEAGVRTLTLEEAKALSPSKEFPEYSAPGHSSPLQHAPNIGYSGRKPRGYAGGYLVRRAKGSAS
jgi:hypothetical protein